MLEGRLDIIGKKDLQKLGEEIRRALDRLNRTQAWLSRESGIGQATISRLINAQVAKPSGYSVAALAEVLGLDSNYLQSLAGIPVPVPPTERDPAVESIAKRMDSFPDGLRNQVTEIVGNLVDSLAQAMELMHSMQEKE